MTDKRGNVLLGGGIAVASVIVIFVLVPVFVGGDGAATILPITAAALMGGLGVILMLTGLARRPGNAGHEQGAEDRPATKDPVAGGRLAGMVGVMMVYAFAIEPLGFLLGTLLALPVLMLLAGERRPLMIGAIVLGVLGSLQFGFEVLLKAPLPDGRLFSAIL
ncbi:tripartite tricarboxylate transporter TctB family protein [Sediminimonas qiaohouensis]|uniref:tripartite tricarboxylate transporter TctB family protein n=1 Tax=Sediminimonas qiaohouensis TaxID=552061 RepID=UPI0003FDB340|nr:tripartite tricarboxylate transporter TctB family protein [Sediminimonas qiaohouensis]